LGVVSHLLSSVPEIERHVEPYGDIGRFLAQRSKEYSEDHVGFSNVIWDMAPVAWLLDPSWCESVIAPTPIVTDQVTWSVDRARHPMRYVFRIHRDPAADIGSFRQAADVLRLRQSQLSRCVRQLEHSIGVVVFERSSGGVKPTPGGREFLRTARIILEQVDALVASAKTTRRGETGRLAVGFCTSLSTGNLRATLLDFKVHFPHIELGTVERSRTRLTTALRNGTLDILVVTGATPLLESQTLPLERILVALPEDHPLTTRDVVLWTDLQNQTVLLSQYDPGHELEDVLISKLPLPGDRPQIERHDVSRGIIKSLISMRLGISPGNGIRYRRQLCRFGLSRIARPDTAELH